MIRIVIAEDQGMMLGALGSLLSMEDDMEVVGMAKNGEEAISLVLEHQPDVCIMDIEMPIKTGLDAAEALKDGPCKIIILTTFARSGYFERARKAGVRGYLLKDSPIEDLVTSIRTIMEGRRIYAPELVDIAFDDENENPLDRPRKPGTPPRFRREDNEGNCRRTLFDTRHCSKLYFYDSR